MKMETLNSNIDLNWRYEIGNQPFVNVFFSLFLISSQNNLIGRIWFRIYKVHPSVKSCTYSFYYGTMFLKKIVSPRPCILHNSYCFFMFFKVFSAEFVINLSMFLRESVPRIHLIFNADPDPHWKKNGSGSRSFL